MTLVPVSSSWLIDPAGNVHQLAGPVVAPTRETDAKIRNYRCADCGERGHNARTCKTLERRR